MNTVEAERENVVDPMSEERAVPVREQEDLQNPSNEDDTQNTEEAIAAREGETEMAF